VDGCGPNGRLGQNVQISKNFAARIYSFLDTDRVTIPLAASMESIVVETQSKTNHVHSFLVGRKVFFVSTQISFSSIAAVKIAVKVKSNTGLSVLFSIYSS
jgi:hypothetical protein